MYDTNGLTLNDLYPYGEEHGDTARTANDLPAAKLLQPIDNLIGLGLNGLTATIYQVSCIYSYTLAMYAAGNIHARFWHVL